MRELLAEVRASQVATDAMDQAAADFLGINRTDYRALDVLDQKGRLTAGELAREMHLTTGAVTSVLDRLERAGYARRLRDPADRRRVLVEISPEVTRAGEQIYGRPEDAVQGLLEVHRSRARGAPALLSGRAPLAGRAPGARSPSCRSERKR